MFRVFSIFDLFQCFEFFFVFFEVSFSGFHVFRCFLFFRCFMFYSVIFHAYSISFGEKILYGLNTIQTNASLTSKALHIVCINIKCVYIKYDMTAWLSNVYCKRKQINVWILARQNSFTFQRNKVLWSILLPKFHQTWKRENYPLGIHPLRFTYFICLPAADEIRSLLSREIWNSNA